MIVTYFNYTSIDKNGTHNHNTVIYDTYEINNVFYL